MAVLVYKALNTKYLADNCQLITTTGKFDSLMWLPVKFQEPAQIWVIDPSLLLVHVCGTIYHFISVTCELSLLEFCRLMKTHLFG